MANLSPSDFPGICVACLHPPSFNSTIMRPVTIEYLSKVFMPLSLEDNSLYPQQMCMVCFRKCEQWMGFRKIFINNRDKLKSIIANAIVTEDDEEDDEEEEEEELKSQTDENPYGTTDGVQYVVLDDDIPEVVDDQIEPEEEDELIELTDAVEHVVGQEEEVGEEEPVVEPEVEVMPMKAVPMDEFDIHMDYEEEGTHLQTDQNPDTQEGEPLQQWPEDDGEFIEEDYHDMYVITSGQGTRSTHHPKKQTPANDPMIIVECAICQQGYPHCQSYNNHLAEEHMDRDGNAEIGECPHCPHGLPFHSVDKFITHMYLHTSFRFNCPECPAQIAKRTDLAKHLKQEHDNSTGITYRQCHICGETYGSNIELRKHILNEHVDKNQVECFMCPEVFESDRQLGLHLYAHAYGSVANLCCEVCGKQFSSGYSLANHIRTVHNDLPKFPCDICGKLYKSERYLQGHKLRHTMDKSIRCTVCAKMFFTDRELSSHMKQHSENNRSYKCSYCEKGFLNSSVLNEHIKIVHTGDREFHCDMCEKSYFRKRELVEHQRSHTGEKPFSCKVCFKIYARKTTLLTHMKTHRVKN